MKYHLVPFGCQMNISDSERIRAVLESLGYERTDSEEEADLLGIVVCSVRQKAIDKVYGRIHKWNQWKKRRNLVTFASGCILPADRESFLDRFDLLFAITDLPSLPELLRNYGIVTPASLRAAEQTAGRTAGNTIIPTVTSGGESSSSYWQIPADYSSSFEAFVPIQNGCDKFCSFCAVPYTRGREVSRPSEEILAEVRSLVDSGYRSITLLGQNVNSYGLDRRSRGGREIGFAELLRRIGEFGNRSGRRFWVYFTSPHPHDMSNEVIAMIARYPVLAAQVHLPVQSADDKVLNRMNRGYRISEYRKIIRTIRTMIPEATIFTDIIVGFSGETEEQHARTRAIMEEIRYNMAYVAIYSPRRGAASARWDDDVSREEKRRRLHDLSAVLQRTSGEYNRALIGRDISILVEGKDRRPGYLSGKTEGKLIVRFPLESEELIGRFVTVRITSAAPLSMEGTLLGPEPDTLSGGVEYTSRSHEAYREAAAAGTAKIANVSV
jgi:tRNA-2-methylthio-N6-dimethylallyladenosine synthase